MLSNIASRLYPREASGLSTWTHIDGSCQLLINGDIHGSVEDWEDHLSAALLHIGFGHHLIPADADLLLWNMAADIHIASLHAATGYSNGVERVPQDCPKIKANQWQKLQNHPAVARYEGGELFRGGRAVKWYGQRDWTVKDWQALLATGLREHAADAIDNVATEGWRDHGPRTKNQLILSWFMANFPLLSSLAAGFRLLEDVNICRRMDIAVAAVDVNKKTIYLNPRAGLDEEEWRFVVAHEILHVALMHQQRQLGRDHFLWNLSTDFTINQWLLDMRIGQMPAVGCCHDPELKGMAAEEIYTLLTNDIRRAKRLLTLRGDKGDMIGDYQQKDVSNVDDWVRGALMRGLELHHAYQRGDLPADFMEEIEHIAQEPPDWDAQMAEWFGVHFPPLTPQRSYARASRRQSSTPNIARPGRHLKESDVAARVFAVVIDTSGSMGAGDLGRALGAIASYAWAHEVHAVRIIECDAAPYDRGWVQPDGLVGAVEMHGRGGTVIQPALDFIDHADDIPSDAPLMIITDGMVEAALKTRREHCYLLAPGCSMWYPANGPVFTMSV